MSMPSKKGLSTGKPELTKILSASHRDAAILEADVTFVTHAIARALTDTELQAPALDNFPPLTRCDSKTIMSS